MNVNGAQCCFGLDPPTDFIQTKTVETIAQTSYFVFYRRTKAIQVWNNIIMTWWTVPLRRTHGRETDFRAQSFRESYLNLILDSMSHGTQIRSWHFYTHLSDHVTTPVIARERLSGSVGPYAVWRDRWCVAWWQDGEKPGKIAAYFPFVNYCEFNVFWANAEVKLVQMSYNVAVRMSNGSLEILSDSPQAEVWWPSGEGAVKCRDIAWTRLLNVWQEAWLVEADLAMWLHLTSFPCGTVTRPW